MTNDKLLQYVGKSTQLLTERERQLLYCLRIALTPAPCPVCGRILNQVEASGLPLNEFPAGNTSQVQYRCPDCQSRLLEVVPFMGPVYLWQADHQELRKRLNITPTKEQPDGEGNETKAV